MTEDDVDQPEIADEEMADFGAVAEEIEAEAEADDVDDPDEDPDVEDDAIQEDVDELESSGPDVSVGTVYCNGLGMGAAVARARYGSADEDDREELVDEYSSMAEQLQIDDAVDEWMAQHGGIDQLSPGQAILASTMLFASMVAMDDPEMLENLGEEVSA